MKDKVGPLTREALLNGIESPNEDARAARRIEKMMDMMKAMEAKEITMKCEIERGVREQERLRDCVERADFQARMATNASSSETKLKECEGRLQTTLQ